MDRDLSALRQSVHELETFLRRESLKSAMRDLASVLADFSLPIVLKYNQNHDERGLFATGDGGGGGGSSGGASGGSATPATDLYTAPTKTADQIVAEHGGSAQAIQVVHDRLAASTPTDALVSAGGFKNADGTYTADRQAIHAAILDNTFTPSAETAAGRALSRFSRGGTYTGRFVPPAVILGNVNNERNFDKLSSGMTKWAVYDNNTSSGPRLVASKGL